MLNILLIILLGLALATVAGATAGTGLSASLLPPLS